MGFSFFSTLICGIIKTLKRFLKESIDLESDIESNIDLKLIFLKPN